MIGRWFARTRLQEASSGIRQLPPSWHSDAGCLGRCSLSDDCSSFPAFQLRRSARPEAADV